MYFRLRASFEIDGRISFSAADARQKGQFLHRLFDENLRLASAPVDEPGGEPLIIAVGIVPPRDRDARYERGAMLEFDLNVFARSPLALPVVITALSGLERYRGRGLQGRLALRRVRALSPVQPPWTLFDAAAPHCRQEAGALAIAPDDLCETGAGEGVTLSLRALTPIIISTPAKRQLKLEAEAPRLGRLVRAILRRCEACWPEAQEALFMNLSRAELEAHADRMERDSVTIDEQRDMESLSYRSSTHDGKIPIAGFAGIMNLAGPWQPLLPVLHVGSWIQVGQKAALGYGAYSLAVDGIPISGV